MGIYAIIQEKGSSSGFKIDFIRYSNNVDKLRKKFISRYNRNNEIFFYRNSNEYYFNTYIFDLNADIKNITEFILINSNYNFSENSISYNTEKLEKFIINIKSNYRNKVINEILSFIE